jgi:pimeloyl-ACP methyl ester carboxylesterase
MGFRAGAIESHSEKPPRRVRCSAFPISVEQVAERLGLHLRTAALQRLTMPVMLIVGARDAMLDSTETRERLERNVADLEVLWLSDAGHAIVGQTAPIFAFLQRSSPRID